MECLQVPKFHFHMLSSMVPAARIHARMNTSRQIHGPATHLWMWLYCELVNQEIDTSFGL